jgi:hypothetical protein
MPLMKCWSSEATKDGLARRRPCFRTALMVRLVFHQLLRQTEGPLGSLLEFMGVGLPVPVHSTTSLTTCPGVTAVPGGKLFITRNRSSRNVSNGIRAPSFSTVSPGRTVTVATRIGRYCAASSGRSRRKL